MLAFKNLKYSQKWNRRSW